MKCCDCKHCELKTFDIFTCEKIGKYITMSAYGVYEYERNCKYFESKEDQHGEQRTDG